MSDTNIEYVTEEERSQFILLVCDLPHDMPGDEVRARRFDIAAQLVSESAHDSGRDLSTIDSKYKFAADVIAAFEAFSKFAEQICQGEPLAKADYLKYVGLHWRTMRREDIIWAHRDNPEMLETILAIRDGKSSRVTMPGLYEGLGLIDPARTRRSQHPSLSQGREARYGGHRARNIPNN